eukprot:UN05406
MKEPTHGMMCWVQYCWGNIVVKGGEKCQSHTDEERVRREGIMIIICHSANKRY